MQNKLVDNIDRKGAGSKERSLGQTDRPKSCMWDALQKALCAPPPPHKNYLCYELYWSIKLKHVGNPDKKILIYKF